MHKAIFCLIWDLMMKENNSVMRSVGTATAGGLAVGTIIGGLPGAIVGTIIGGSIGIASLLLGK